MENKQSFLSSTPFDEERIKEAMNIYRQSQPQYEPDSITFPEFNREKLFNAYQLFCTCIETNPNNVEALLMKAHCTYYLGDKEKFPEAMESIDKAIHLNPNNPFAYDLLGTFSYAINSEADKEKAIQLSINNKKKVLELNPQYSNDLGFNVSMRSTTNIDFRNDLEDLKKGLEKFRLEQRVKEESELAPQTKVAITLPEFNKITTQSPKEATNVLFKEAIHSIPAISVSKVRKYYLDVSSKWDSEQLFEETTEKVTSIVLENLFRLSEQEGFQDISVQIIEEDECAQINVFFSKNGEYTFQPIRVWRSIDKTYVCGNATFNRNKKQSEKSSNILAKRKRNDWDKMNLKGKVKSINQNGYKAWKIFGIIKKDKLAAVTHYLFNDSGNIIEKTYNPKNGSNALKDVYRYDNNGNKIEHDRYVFGKDKNATYKYTYKHDDSGKLIEMKAYETNGNLNYFCNYNYNYNSNQIEWNKETLSPSKYADKYVDKYDDNENLIERKRIGSGDSETWKYNGKGHEIEWKQFINYGSELWRMFTYMYDEIGNVIEVVKHNIRSNDEGGKARYKYDYDKDLNWVRKIRLDKQRPLTWDGDESIYEERIEEREIVYF